MKKDYLKHYQNIYKFQIRFNVYDSIRFEKSYSIISLNFYNSFFIQNIKYQITLNTQMLRRRS